MKKQMIIAGLVIVLVAAVAFFLFRKKSKFDSGGSGVSGRNVTDKGNLIVYGSKTCPWCQKQEAYLNSKYIPYTFVDCKVESCPEFVSGYPTLLLNNQVINGYTEI